MNEKITERIKELTSPILEKGFVFDAFYEKGGDSSCVYIFRFKKGRDFFDWREISGSDQINFVSFVNGVYGFPNLTSLYKKEYRAFRLKHLFQKATMDERRVFFADLLVKNCQGESFFGILL